MPILANKPGNNHMAAIAPLYLNDGASTPVSHTFSPVKIDSAGVASFADRVSGIALGFPVVSASVRGVSKTSRNYRVTGKVVLPILEVTSPSTATGIQPAPTKAYDLIATVEFVLPERSSLAERNNLLAYVGGFLNTGVIQDAVKNFEPVY